MLSARISVLVSINAAFKSPGIAGRDALHCSRTAGSFDDRLRLELSTRASREISITFSVGCGGSVLAPALISAVSSTSCVSPFDATCCTVATCRFKCNSPSGVFREQTRSMCVCQAVLLSFRVFPCLHYQQAFFFSSCAVASGAAAAHSVAVTVTKLFTAEGFSSNETWVAASPFRVTNWAASSPGK